MIICVLSLSELETILAQKAGWHFNGEPQATGLRWFSNAALDSLELLLFTGWKTSFEKWL